MKFENTGIENATVELERLNDVMKELGFVLAGQWDYERVTYDKKFELKDEVFYLRVQGYTTEGEVEGKHAIIKLLTPLLGKHYYPHGVEYGEGEKFPKVIVEQSTRLLNQLKLDLEKIK
ncbi:YugN family protein [Litchfieldia alkalitelluris]|uniref:YugN family protein n=1 Tax=Litchfieldia alkalitelluris TaxID=304268 RepID=UPI00099790BF|nr:YugN family protein [Litchfieldia alkalitelluris]